MLEIPYTTLHIIILSPVHDTYIHALCVTSNIDPGPIHADKYNITMMIMIIRHLEHDTFVTIYYTYFNQGTVCSSIMHFHKSTYWLCPRNVYYVWTCRINIYLIFFVTTTSIMWMYFSFYVSCAMTYSILLCPHDVHHDVQCYVL